MFGISSLGWVHTLGSLPAIPLALYMLIRHGRIVPRSRAGLAYLLCMLVGGVTVFVVAKAPVSPAIGGLTLLLLLAGYGVGRIHRLGVVARYLETVFLSMTVLLLMVPAVSETLRRVPDGHPIVTDLKSPLLLGAQGGLLVLFVLGLTAQLIHLARSNGARAKARG